jgi:antirestriction protein ArdC
MAGNQLNQNRLKEITDSIEQGIQDLFQSDRYAQYLATMSRFHRYSVNNTMLIYLQKPDATLVAGFNKWRDQFARNVKKGEKGIKIIAPTPFRKKIEEEKLDPDTKLPMLDADGKVILEEKEIKIPLYKPVTVFDVSQTDGKPLPQLAADLTGNVQNYDVFMEALRRTSPVPIDMKPIADSTDGFFSRKDQRITIRAGMSEVQTISAAVHEIAHSKLHNTKAVPEDEEPAASKDRHTEEVEAESVSYAVCAYYGIATGENSFGYIAGWSKGKELQELRASLETINKTASELITGIDRHYAEICKERGIDSKAPAEQAEPEQGSALYLVNDAVYIHVQTTDDGYDFTVYSKNTMREVDGGQLDQPDISVFAACLEICKMQGIDQHSIQAAPLDMVETLQTAQTAQISAALHGTIVEAEIVPPVEEAPVFAASENGAMPDPTMSIEAMCAYGYTDSDMLPLSKERALELLDRDVPVYMLYDDNSAAMAFEAEDIQLYSGFLGVSREDWEQVRHDIPPMDAAVLQQKREQAFLNSTQDSFAIYQLRDNENTTSLQFMSMAYLEQHGVAPIRENYDLVYSAPLTVTGAQAERLEELYYTFNMERPADFRGHSLSVSDIVAMKQSGVVSCHYVDSFGYKELPWFLTQDNYLKNAEMQLEDDYGMIDGIVNNGKKEPEKSAAVQPEERPSVLEKLRKYQAESQQTVGKIKEQEQEL